MREILFKGKRVDNEEWIYGYLFNILDMAFILSGVCVVSDGSEPTPNMYQVIPSTIGQFTGLIDKNSIKIFEGDILHEPYRKTKNVIVTYKDGNFHLVPVGIYSASSSGELSFCKQNIDYFKYKIIGNIHDNPELLEKA